MKYNRKKSILSAGILLSVFAFVVFGLISFPFGGTVNADTTNESNSSVIRKSRVYIRLFDKYQHLKPQLSGLDLPVFMNAYLGFLNLREEGLAQSSMLTIVDLNKPSHEPRMWVIDLEKDSLLIHTWAAHGVGSGLEKAEKFSNEYGSLQSSLGFYLTAEEYRGKNGRSLRLDGLDEGFNTNARKRAVVMHGADYVSQAVINRDGYLGNSEGCPAVDHAVNDLIIDAVKGRSVLYISGPSDLYASKWLDAERLLHSGWFAP